MHKGMNANELKALIEAIQAAERLKALSLIQNANGMIKTKPLSFSKTA